MGKSRMIPYHPMVTQHATQTPDTPVRDDSPGILPRVAMGDADAVQECLDRFGGLVWSLARKLLASATEAEDAVQEIFVDVWRSAGRYDASIASETAFVAMIARRRLIDRQRKIGRRPVEEQIFESTSSEPDRQAERVDISAEARRAIGALEQLSPEQQRVLRLAIHNGLSHEKIARATGLPLGTVKTHARRGLIKLRAILGADPQTATDAEGGES